MKPLSIVVIILFLSTSFAHSQHMKRKEGNRVDVARSTFIDSLAKGDTFISDNQTYALFTGLLAMKKEASGSNGFLADSNRKELETPLGSTEIIEEKGNFLIFRDNMGTFQYLDSDKSIELFPVVINLRTKQYGIFLKEILITIDDLSLVHRIADDFRMEIVKVFPQLNLAVLKTDDDMVLTNTLEQLRADRRIKNIQLDIQENPYVTM